MVGDPQVRVGSVKPNKAASPTGFNSRGACFRQSPHMTPARTALRYAHRPLAGTILFRALPLWADPRGAESVRSGLFLFEFLTGAAAQGADIALRNDLAGVVIAADGADPALVLRHGTIYGGGGRRREGAFLQELVHGHQARVAEDLALHGVADEQVIILHRNGLRDLQADPGGHIIGQVGVPGGILTEVQPGEFVHDAAGFIAEGLQQLLVGILAHHGNGQRARFQQRVAGAVVPVEDHRALAGIPAGDLGEGADEASIVAALFRDCRDIQAIIQLFKYIAIHKISPFL